MTISAAVTDQRGMMKVVVTGVAAATAGGIGALLNPEGVAIGITRAFVYFRTGSTGATTFDVGVGATATTANASVMDFADAIEATVGGKFIYGPTAQVAITEVPTAVWGATEYLVFTGSATTVGLDADVYVEYVRLA